MKALFSISIYQRANDVVVVPMSGGVGAPLFAVEPIERIAGDPDSLAQAIERSMAVSDLSIGAVNLRDYKSPIPKALTLERHASDGRGFEPTGRVANLTPPKTANDIAETVLKLLHEATA